MTMVDLLDKHFWTCWWLALVVTGFIFNALVAGRLK